MCESVEMTKSTVCFSEAFTTKNLR